MIYLTCSDRSFMFIYLIVTLSATGMVLKKKEA